MGRESGIRKLHYASLRPASIGVSVCYRQVGGGEERGNGSILLGRGRGRSEYAAEKLEEKVMYISHYKYTAE